MAATLTRLLFINDGRLFAIVSVSNDGDLTPHQAPPGGVAADVPKAAYDACQSNRDILVLAQPIVALLNPLIGAAITAQIQAIDAAAAQAGLG